ncbi:uncharacterized protein V1518DRAFT_419838 [Limtongia smithiae]|uniref:uncharacterized protein n=1 Tax=Limtongia smithiae TaxID=1125753 RepID=UPI0034CFB0CA
MAKKGNAISFENRTPKFLQVLRGLAQDEPSVSTKFTSKSDRPDDDDDNERSDDETAIPEYIFEGERISKEEFEQLKKGVDITQIKAARVRALEDAEKSTTQPTQTTAADVRKGAGARTTVSEFGSRPAKRKTVSAVKSNDGPTSDSESRSSSIKDKPPPSTAPPKRRKKLKVNLSFDHGDE